MNVLIFIINLILFNYIYKENNLNLLNLMVQMEES